MKVCDEMTSGATDRGDEAPVEQYVLSDGSTFDLEPDDIEWNPVPHDEANLREAECELATLPEHHEALADLLQSFQSAAWEARRAVQKFTEYILDVDSGCDLKQLSGLDPIFRLDNTRENVVGTLNEALGRLTAVSYRRVALRTEDLNSSRIWTSRRDEALRIRAAQLA